MTTTTSLRLAEEIVDPAEARINAEFVAFLKAVSLRRYPTGPVQRFNQGRAAGCVSAQFTVLDTISPEHRVGIFAAPRTYDAWIRFANASSQSDREKDVRGMGMRVAGVSGENLTPGESRQDFVLNSHPVMVAANTKDFLELLKAMDAGGLRQVTLLSVASAIGGHRIPGPTTTNQPPRHTVLEHDAIPVRSRARREVHHAPVRDAREYAATSRDRYVSDRRIA